MSREILGSHGPSGGGAGTFLATRRRSASCWCTRRSWAGRRLIGSVGLRGSWGGTGANNRLDAPSTNIWKSRKPPDTCSVAASDRLANPWARNLFSTVSRTTRCAGRRGRRTSSCGFFPRSELDPSCGRRLVPSLKRAARRSSIPRRLSLVSLIPSSCSSLKILSRAGCGTGERGNRAAETCPATHDLGGVNGY
jgi:hypothetical protein